MGLCKPLECPKETPDFRFPVWKIKKEHFIEINLTSQIYYYKAISSVTQTNKTLFFNVVLNKSMKKNKTVFYKYACFPLHIP